MSGTGDGAPVAADPSNIPDDTIIHWLLGGFTGLATLFTGMLAWNGKDAMQRLREVEDNKAEKGDMEKRFAELLQQQRERAERTDAMHAENRATLNSIWQMLANRPKQ